MTKNNPTVGFQNLPNSKVASRQLIRSIYQPGCIIINNCALCPLQAQGMASVPRSLRYACERAHTLGLPDCTAGRKQGRARSEIACKDGKVVVTLHRRNAGKGRRCHRQETHKQLNAHTKTFHNMNKNKNLCLGGSSVAALKILCHHHSRGDNRREQGDAQGDQTHHTAQRMMHRFFGEDGKTSAGGFIRTYHHDNQPFKEKEFARKNQKSGRLLTSGGRV